MGAGLKKNGTRAFVAVTLVCAALSPAALAAVGGVSAERPDATASRLVRAAPVVGAAEGVLDASAPGGGRSSSPPTPTEIPRVDRSIRAVVVATFCG
jgi:hypothetical protein